MISHRMYRLSALRSIFVTGIIILLLTLVAPVLSMQTGAMQENALRATGNSTGGHVINRTLAASWIANSAELHVYGCPAGYDTSGLKVQDLIAMVSDCDEDIGPVAFTLLHGQYGTEYFTTTGSYPTNQVTNHSLDFVGDYWAENAGQGIPGIFVASIPNGYDSVVVWCSYWSRQMDDTIWGPSIMPRYGSAIQVAVDAGDTMRCDWFFGQDGFAIIEGSQASMIDLPDTEPSGQVERGPIVTPVPIATIELPETKPPLLIPICDPEIDSIDRTTECEVEVPDTGAGGGGRFASNLASTSTGGHHAS